LGGYSLGGLIAFEVAQQLHHVGQRVAVLALFDSAPGICVMPWAVYGRAMAGFLWGRCVFHLRRLWEMPKRDWIDYLGKCCAALKLWIGRNRSKPVVVAAPPPKGIQPPQVPGFADYYVAVASAYRLRRYPGSVDVFVSDEAQPLWVSFWRHLVRGVVSYHQVPGSHREILSPDYLPALATSLATVLQRAQQKNAPPRPSSGHTHANLVS
jgi:pimeloyl-ACP methyl ester carboxylesterase